MKCKCGKKASCTDSRSTNYGVRRRFVCKSCGDRFSTVEVIAITNNGIGEASEGGLINMIEAQEVSKLKKEIFALKDALTKQSQLLTMYLSNN